jgi:hypothetical protein
MVTSIPPARTRPADRFPMSAPITSKTRSTPPNLPGCRCRGRRTPACRGRVWSAGRQHVRRARIIPATWSNSRSAGSPRREVDIAWRRRDVTRLDDHVLGQGAVTSPVREAEHPPSHRQPPRAMAERGDHTGHLVARDRRCAVAAQAIGPGPGPRRLDGGETRRMNLDKPIVPRRLRLWPLRQRHPSRSRGFICHHNRLHLDASLHRSFAYTALRLPHLVTPDVGVLPS